MKELHLSTKIKALCATLLMLPVSMLAQDSNGTTVFTETFDTEEDFNQWLIVDLNESAEGGRTWEYLNDAAAYMLDYQTGLPGDDWLISPAFSLDASKVYELYFTTYVPNNNNIESLGIYIGQTRSTDGMTQQLIDLPELYRDNNGTKTAKIVVATSGEYYLGLYAYSAPEQIRVEVDDISITEVSSADVPNPVTDLQATAAELGALQATVSFTTPALTAGETTLEKLTAINIYRGSDLQEPIHVIENPGIGSDIEWTDQQPEHGFNTYTVTAINSDGSSEPQEATVYVGIDTPSPVQEVAAAINTDYSITVTWQAPTTSVNGGYIDYSTIRYRVLRNDEEIADDIAETSYTDEVPIERGQTIVSYKVIPYSSAGDGEATSSNEVACGLPLQIPYSESFANGAYQDDYSWYQDATCNDIDWTVTGDDTDNEVYAYDSDGGMLMAQATYGYSGDTSRLISPLLDLSAIPNPVLTFYIYHGQSQWYDPAWDGEINDRVEVQIAIDGGEWQTLDDASFYTSKDNDGWTKCEVVIPQYDCTFVNFGLLAVVDNESYSQCEIYIDNISIDEAPYDNDLSLRSFSVDNKRIGIGEQSSFTATVLNRGASAVSGYTVNLLRDGEQVQSVNGEEIAPTAIAEVSFDFTATLDDAQQDEITWTATVTYAQDENANNDNSDEITTSVRRPYVPAVTGLTATQASGAIQLTWNAARSIEATPETDPISVTDDFESYEPFIIDNIGNWTMHDLDGSTTLSSPRIPNDYPHRGEPMAFQVFNVIDAGVVTDESYDQALLPNSGDQYLICPSVDWPAENDDWLVSPRLDGRSQTISFYAKAASYDYEWIRVYYSTTDTHPDSFIKISDGDQVYVGDYWTQYSYELPEDAKYFAIQCCRRVVFLLIDDVTYCIHSGAEDPVTLIGYNVYRNGSIINEEVVTTNSYDDTTAEEGTYYSYRVTAVYEEGESDYSDEVSITSSGIDATSMATGTTITTHDNTVFVKSNIPCDITIFTTDGKAIYNATNSSEAVISLDHGVYIVKAGSTVRKIIL